MNKLILFGIVSLVCLVSVLALNNNAADISFDRQDYLSNNVANIEFLDSSNGTAPSDPCTYSGSGDWLIEDSVCNITVATDLLGNDLTISNSTVFVSAQVSNYASRMVNEGSVVTWRFN